MASLNLTLRQRKLLHTIQNRKDMITGQELAGLLNASARTIRSDVVMINHELKPYGASIESIRSKGYFFTAEDPDSIRKLNRIETAFFTREDRIRTLALELCIAEEPLSCFDLEDEMFISHTTLENDIRLLRLRYMMNGPRIRIITGHNDISFEQDELKRRQLLSELYMEHWNYDGRGNAVYGMSYLNPDLLDRVIDMIPVHLDRHGIRMDDAAIVELNLACTILYRRICSGHLLPDAEPLSRSDPQADRACEELLNALEEELSFTIPPNERDRIYLLIASGHMMDPDRLSFETVQEEFSPDVIGMADAYIEAIRDVYGLDFSNDEDFYITILQDIRYLMNPVHRLVSQSRPEDAPLAFFPPTYYKGDLQKSDENNGKTMAMEAAKGPGPAFLDLYDLTGDKAWFDRAVAIARTYKKIQRPDGSFPIKMDFMTGEAVNETGAMLHPLLNFLRRLQKQYGIEEFKQMQEAGEKWMMAVPLKTFDMTGQFEDVSVMKLKPYENLTNCTAAPYADYLYCSSESNADDLRDADDLMRLSEDQFTYWDQKPLADGIHQHITPCVYEQYRYQMSVDNSACNVAGGFLAKYERCGDQLALAKAIALTNSITLVQNANTGQIPTTWVHYTDVNKGASFWLNCTVSSINMLLRMDEALKGKSKFRFYS